MLLNDTATADTATATATAIATDTAVTEVFRRCF